MLQKVKLSFYGPNKFSDNKTGIDRMLKMTLEQFMAQKGITDYKINSIEYKERTATKIIGTYLYHGMAEVEFRGGVNNESKTDNKKV